MGDKTFKTRLVHSVGVIIVAKTSLYLYLKAFNIGRVFEILKLYAILCVRTYVP